MTQDVLLLDDVIVDYRLRGAGRPLRAVDRVSLRIEPGESLGLVGESGSGKSTIGRTSLGLVKPTAGRAVVAGRDLAAMSRRDRRTHRRHMQMVFQDPYSSLDPSMVVGRSIAEPLSVHERLRKGALEDRVNELLVQVGLDPAHAHRYPSEFSGGQRQRIAIARAIATNPQLLILDEPVSALDVSTQNQILDLLDRLRSKASLSYLFISHDLAVVRQLCDRIAVMYLGRIVETGPTEQVLDDPQHPYTRALRAAVPSIQSAHTESRRRHHVPAEQADPTERYRGCSFRGRCPLAHDRCDEEQPQLVEVPGLGAVACHMT